MVMKISGQLQDRVGTSLDKPAGPGPGSHLNYLNRQCSTSFYLLYVEQQRHSPHLIACCSAA
jgi:hypothetical protein